LTQTFPLVVLTNSPDKNLGSSQLTRKVFPSLSFTHALPANKCVYSLVLIRWSSLFTYKIFSNLSLTATLFLCILVNSPDKNLESSRSIKNW
jgi:hypothetical protein